MKWNLKLDLTQKIKNLQYYSDFWIEYKLRFEEEENIWKYDKNNGMKTK